MEQRDCCNKDKIVLIKLISFSPPTVLRRLCFRPEKAVAPHSRVRAVLLHLFLPVPLPPAAPALALSGGWCCGAFSVAAGSHVVVYEK